MPLYRLHYFPESGNSYKLALMLSLCGQGFEPVWTDFAAGVTRTPEWRAAVNEMGEIPVLEEDGTRLTQTAPILLRLAERHGRLAGRDEAERFEVLRWLFWDNHKLTGYMAPYRYLRAFTPDPDPHDLAFLRKRLRDVLAVLDRRMETNAFAIGERATVADVSMSGYLTFGAEEHGFDFARTHPAVAAWLARVAGLEGWRAPYDLLPGKRMKLLA
ncbi:MAG: glutathione S-transferase family protein [Pseudomonadota bacterium]|nr:glutathione S-transferase family protein [Pseudomonadota bacterium]MEE3100660.1 glutathione S-transferase family protein [Pseudomonadota bacterium]